MTGPDESAAPPPQATGAAGRGWMGWIAILLPWPPIAYLIFFFATHVWLRGLIFPFQLDYGESPVLHAGLSLLRGKPVYPLMGGYPYQATPYAPLYLLLDAAGLCLLGAGFFPGRLISLLSGLAAVWLAAVIVRRLTGSRSAAALAAGLILSVAYFSWWTILARIDALAWALSLLGLWLFLRGRLAWAVVAFAAAIMARQSALAAPAAVLLSLLLTRRWRQAAAAFAGLAGLVGAASALTWATMGAGFYEHAVALPGHARWLWWQLRYAGGLVLSSWPVLLALGCIGAAWALKRGRGRAVALYFFIAGALSITAAKIGAGPNYFVEALVLACIGAALAFHLARQASRLLGLLVAIALAAQLVFMAVNAEGLLSYVTAPAGGAASMEVLRRVAETPGPVICEDYSLLDLANREVALEPLEFTDMVRAGMVDPGPVLDDVRRGRFSLIVMRMDPAHPRRLPGHPDYAWGVWYAPLADEIARSYRLDERVGQFYLLRPRAN